MATGFDEMGKTLRKFGKDAISGMQRIGESYQASSKLSDAHKEVRKLYAQLGEAVWETYKDGEAPEAYEALFAAIAEAKKVVRAQEEEVQRIKGVAVCTRCGKEAAKGEVFCSACGTRLPEIIVPAEEPEAEAPAEEQAAETAEAAEETAESTEDVTEAENTEDAAAAKQPADEESAESAEDAQAEAESTSDNEKTAFDAAQLEDAAKAAGRAVGTLVNEAADQAKGLLDNVAQKAGVFMDGVTTRLAEREAARKEEAARAEAEKAMEDAWEMPGETAKQPAAEDVTAETAAEETAAEGTAQDPAAEGDVQDRPEAAPQEAAAESTQE